MTGRRAKPWTERTAVRDVERGLDWAEPPTIVREPGAAIWRSRAGLGHYSSRYPWTAGDKLMRRFGDTVRLEGQVLGDYIGDGAERIIADPETGRIVTDVHLTVILNGERA